MRFIILLIVCLALIVPSLGCAGKSTKSSSSSSSSSSYSSSGTGESNVFTRGSFDNDGQGQSAQAGVQCVNGVCKKYESTETWG